MVKCYLWYFKVIFFFIGMYVYNNNYVYKGGGGVGGSCCFKILYILKIYIDKKC